MRIHFERTGGFMGLRIAGTVDTDSLSEEEALPLREMIEAASLFEQPETPSISSSGADLFQYKLVVEDEDRQHTIEITDSTAPEELRPLLRRLTVLTRSGPASTTESG
jgi:hypothetical protein